MFPGMGDCFNGVVLFVHPHSNLFFSLFADLLPLSVHTVFVLFCFVLSLQLPVLLLICEISRKFSEEGNVRSKTGHLKNILKWHMVILN